jgi:subtilase family serine protease
MRFQLLVTRTSLLFIFVALTAISVLAQANAVHPLVTQPVDLHDLVTLHGNIHPLARPEFDQGVAPDDLPMERMLLVLQRGADQETALRKLLDDQQAASSPQFHHWLTPVQFGQQFGPTDSDLQAVTGWLTTQGFQVAKVSAGRTVIEFSGSAGLVRQVLGTEIHRFRVNGKDSWANTGDPQIPAALAPVVAGFASLNNFPAKPMHENLRTVSRVKSAPKAQPLFTYPVVCPGGADEQCYEVLLGPTDFATIYNVLPLWNKSTDGSGVTIAVVGESNINPQDVADFRAMFGLPANSPNVIVNGPDPGLASDETEADLDVEWSGAVAKGATIDLVVSESTEATLGVDLSALYIIDNDLAPIMSESYGVCEAQSGAGGNIFHSALWEQAAAEGITVLMASGDSGSAVCDREDPNFGVFAAQYGLSVSGFASTPFNVAVGGTDLNITSSNIATYFTQTNTPNTNSSALSYIPETSWNDSCAASGSLTGCTPPPSTTYLDDGLYLVAGSGGPSNCINPTGTFPNFTCRGNYAKPSWQSGTGVPNDSARDVPDVSLLAVNYVICQMDANGDENSSLTTCNLDAPQPSFQVVGGTSASVQAFAGIIAMVNQVHGRQGNANYVLYPLAAENSAGCNSSTTPVTNSTCIFYDVTVGNNSVICQGGSPNCSNTDSASGQYGILVSGNPSVAAFTTTPGYDLATGLGSVNVANLVNNWKSNFTPSTITLALSTNPTTNPIALTHGGCTSGK